MRNAMRRNSEASISSVAPTTPESGVKEESTDQCEFRSAGITNAMSVDVEEHFHVSAFEGQLNRRDWDSQPSRVAGNTYRLIDLFNEYDVSATFFTLGWVARRMPDLIKAIASAGHEIASHGYDHRRVASQTADEFRDDTRKTKRILEDLTGHEVIGYRAPSFSISQNTPWAHDILGEVGYKYSSSVYPIRHDHYGVPDAPRSPYRKDNGGLLEIPLATTRLAGQNLPAAGGGYFRLLPFAYSKWALSRINRHEERPVAFYLHPWEIDPDQPRVSGLPFLSRFRHYTNLGRFENRLKSILADFAWGRMDDVYGQAISHR